MTISYPSLVEHLYDVSRYLRSSNLEEEKIRSFISISTYISTKTCELLTPAYNLFNIFLYIYIGKFTHICMIKRIVICSNYTRVYVLIYICIWL